MDASIHRVTGIRIAKSDDPTFQTVDIVIEYQELAHTNTFYPVGEEVFGYAKLEHTLTLFIHDDSNVEQVLSNAIADITSKYV